MNKTIKTMLALMAGAMVFTACRNDDEFENINESKSPFHKMTFFASQEGQEGTTRAEIDGLDIKWSAGDKITVFDGVKDDDGSFAREFTIKSGEEGSTSAAFSGEAADASIYYALYPSVVSKSVERDLTYEEVDALASGHLYMLEVYFEYGDEDSIIETMEMDNISPENQAIIFAYLKGEKIEKKSGVQRNASNQFEDVVIPAEQTATAGSADPKAMLMIGESDDANSLQFKNVCAYIKVTPTFDCTSIVIKSNGNENLAGTVTVDYNNGAPTATVTTNGSNKVLLSGTITKDNDYYIAVTPGTLASGFTVEFYTAGSASYYFRSTSKSTAIARSKVINLGTFNKESLSVNNNYLTGKFSVSATKQIYFAKGNLYYDGSTFNFENSQLNYTTSWNTSHITHFYWSKNPAVAYANKYSDASASTDDVLFTNATQTTPNASFTVGLQTGVWRTLSSDEWNYLLFERTGAANKYNAKVTVNGHYYLVLAPDDFTGTIESTYTNAEVETAEQNGLVFLSYAGFKYDTYTSISNTNVELTYVSSTPNSSEKTESARVFINNSRTDGLLIQKDGGRCWGANIRLVTDVIE